MFGFLKKLFGASDTMPAAGTLGIAELVKRLGINEQDVRGVAIVYRTFQIPKRTGGTRTIAAPADPLKALQRKILRRVLGRLRAHPCATGFERGHSIVTNALPHAGKEMVVRLDLKDFFGSTSAARVEAYFRRIGWNDEAAQLLTQLCTHEGKLPQGAPTSPRLSNLLNYQMDARLAALAHKDGASYSRYADDITLSAAAMPRPTPLVHAVKRIVKESGYVLHTDKKLRMTRRHDRQMVTGLVVNQKVNLPRRIRRKLRAIEHHLKTGKPATLTTAQLEGWRSLEAMILSQSSTSADEE